MLKWNLKGWSLMAFCIFIFYYGKPKIGHLLHKMGFVHSDMHTTVSMPYPSASIYQPSSLSILPRHRRGRHVTTLEFHRINSYTANVFAVKFTGFSCVPLEPCKVHVFITGKWVPSQSL